MKATRAEYARRIAIVRRDASLDADAIAARFSLSKRQAERLLAAARKRVAVTYAPIAEIEGERP